MNKDYVVKDSVELQQLLGEPKEMVKQKVVKNLDEMMINFIQRSPLIFIASCGQNGLPDISPKGDAPGFVQVNQDGALLIPERPGNKLMFGFNNILENNRVGLIFVIPDTRETLRVKGKATLSRDPNWLQALAEQGKPALLCTHVEVAECFFHCGKAMIRSQLWKTESWGADEQLMVRHFANKNDIDQQKIETTLEQSYEHNLY
ncbi:MAG: pyridoxamine 5'-phosphate oxidase family protein [Arenicella sp.]|nr:pyridoxamine 5'-phosphate oxidase family protein [Arenicella sp.]